MTPRIGLDWSRAPDVHGALTSWPAVDTAVLQLTVEHGFTGTPDPSWASALDAAAARGDLVAHGVMAAPFLHPPDAMGRDWLLHTARVLQRWPARWLTEHVGACRAGGRQGAPLPLPWSLGLVDATRERLDTIAQTLQIPVGLENLALAVSEDDVALQPDALDAVLRPLDGVLLLDVHNLWCQAVNFGIDAIGLLERYPLDLVRQVHVAGGRWSDHPSGRFRRDTHDDRVPDEVFALLDATLARCPHTEVVVVERLGGTLDDQADLHADLDRTLTHLRPPSQQWTPPIRRPAWRTETPDIQHIVLPATHARDRAAVDAAAPGWWTDDRAWDVAVELGRRWGREAPYSSAM